MRILLVFVALLATTAASAADPTHLVDAPLGAIRAQRVAVARLSDDDLERVVDRELQIRAAVAAVAPPGPLADRAARLLLRAFGRVDLAAYRDRDGLAAAVRGLLAASADLIGTAWTYDTASGRLAATRGAATVPLHDLVARLAAVCVGQEFAQRIYHEVQLFTQERRRVVGTCWDADKEHALRGTRARLQAPDDRFLVFDAPLAAR